MTVLPTLETALISAAESRWRVAAEVTPPALTRRRRPLSRRAAWVAAGAFLVAGTATAAVGPWSPLLGSGDDRPSISTTPVPGDQEAALAVLRRPQTDEDRGPDVQQTLKLIGPQLHGIRTSSIRRLAEVPGGAAITLVSTSRYGDDADPTPYPGSGIASDPLCVVYPAIDAVHNPSKSVTSAAAGCWKKAEIDAGRAHAMAPRGDAGLYVYGLVPDGVSKVVGVWQDGQTATSDVRDNFFEFAASSSGAPAPTTFKWFDAEGRDISPAP